MIIPRYAPIYSYSDLFSGLKNSLSGDPGKELSNRIAKLYGKKHVFLFSRASAALYALLKAHARPGGVILPAYNCIAVPETVLYAGYHPELVDIDINSLNMSRQTVEQSISTTTSVVLITHQFGIPSEINEIIDVCKRKKIFVVEDAASAIGSTYHGKLVGSFGDASIISFHPTKVLSGVTGGALITDDDDIAQRVEKLIRFADVPENSLISFAKAIAWKSALNPRIYNVAHLAYRLLHKIELFEIVSPHSDMPNRFFSQCSNFTSLLIYSQLEELSSNVNRRRELADLYSEELSGSSYWDLPHCPQDSAPAWTQFPLLVKDKRKFYEYMQANGIDLSWTHKYSCADSFKLSGFPGARQAANSVVGLPTYPSLGQNHAIFICNKAKAYEQVN
jgi:dTDP-4-amino-4,6-dideoxygalactose transaminase